MDSCSCLNSILGPDSEDDFSDVERKTKCDCGGFYYPHMKEKHLFSNDRHLLYIAEKFKGTCVIMCISLGRYLFIF